MLCHYCYVKDFGCHDTSMIAYELINTAIQNVKGVDYRCVFWGFSKNEAINILINSMLKDKGIL